MYPKCSCNGPSSLPGQIRFNTIPTYKMLVLVLVLFAVDVRVDVWVGLQWGLELWLRLKSGLGLMLELS